MLDPTTEAPDEPAPTVDREMRCCACGTRIFTSQAEDLVTGDFRCPRCRGSVELVP